MIDSTKILYQPFDLQTHKKTFVDYLEVVILEDGTIEYAVPSHQEKLIDVCCRRLNVDRKTLADMCPPEHWFDYLTFLCETSNSIAVWTDFYKGEPNSQQLKSIDILKTHGLLKGDKLWTE